MKVVVDKDLCTGCGLCADTCSDMFEMQENLAIVKVSDVPVSAEVCTKQAAADCPVEAIKVE